MFAFFYFWIDSLRLLTPTRFLSVLKSTTGTFAHALKIVALHLKWFFIADLLLFIFFGSKIVKMFQVQDDALVKWDHVR